MSEEPKDSQRIYEKLRETILARDLSNSEAFDKALLTYSSSGLALSLSFLSGATQSCAWLLHGSWLLFVLTIIATMSSYPLSQRGLSQQLKNAHDYYIDLNALAFERKNIYASAVRYVSVIAGCLFIGAVCLSTVFVFINNKEINMTGNKKVIPTSHAMDGALVPNMQQIQNGANVPSLTRAANIPAMQAIPQAVPNTSPVVPAPATPAAPASSATTPSTNNWH